jgi:hypothetical protein
LGCFAYTSPSRWNSPATLIGVGVAFAISVVVAGHWWSDKPKLDLDSLGKQVTSGLQNEFDTAEMKCKRGQHLAHGSVMACPWGRQVGTQSRLPRRG